jgi:glycosyltransferase involved in cell wall biosynthesis
MYRWMREDHTPAASAKVSFCTTCKNRLWQLAETLPANLDAAADDGRAELVLVNYDSDDQIDDWVRQFHAHIDSGLLRYVQRTGEPTFHCSKAKNLAHFAATGDFLVNLDADNFIADTLPAWRRAWRARPEALVHGFSGVHFDGSFGRIGLARRNFVALGGYDEDMLPFTMQDVDLIARARRYGLRVFRIPQARATPIPNTLEDKLRDSGLDLSFDEIENHNVQIMLENERQGRVVVNEVRVAVPVTLNFSQRIAL